MFNKRKLAMLVAEFMGVVVLTTSVFSVIRWQLPSMFVAIAAGLVLGLLVNTIGSTSGAHVNPAITLGLWSIRKVTTARAVMYVAVQLLGGLAALALLNYLLGTKLESMITGQFDWKILISEAIGGLIFGFGVASAVYQKMDKNQLAFTVGLSLTAAIFIAGIASNGIVNPALAVGIKSWSWAYAVGPVLGSVIGMNLYALFFTDINPMASVKMPAINRPKTSTLRTNRAKQTKAKTNKKTSTKKK